MNNLKNDIIIIGLGNPLLSDDTIGLVIVQEFKENYTAQYPDVKIAFNYSGGFDLMEELIGFKKSIIVDSICTSQAEAGFCHEFDVKALDKIKQSGLLNSHGLNLPSLLETGKKCGYPLPDQIVLFGIEGRDFTNFSEEPTTAVKGGIKAAITKLTDKLNEWQNN